MSILGDLPGIVSGAMGALLFTQATLKRVAVRVSDGRGGYTQNTTDATVSALITDYSAYMRTIGGIPPNERKALILGDGLANPPAPEDLLTIDGREWTIIEVRTDPASAVWTCRVR